MFKINTGHSNTKEFEIHKTELDYINCIIKEHIDSLSFPMDSWLEDRLIESVKYKIMYKHDCIGYAGIIGETLHFFHVTKKNFRYAASILDKVIEEKTIKKVFVMTQDSLLTALMAEWDYEKEKQACWFTDSGNVESISGKLENSVFKCADLKDVEKIREISGEFFDEESGGFLNLEERIEAGTIFILEDKTELLGCGVIEKSQFYTGVTSIGMFVNREHRKKGVARTILINLKQWAYCHNFIPVAGCWYYNTLSRKSLESAGMIATSIGYEAILKGKEKLPLRTGNPPGELVE